MFDISKEDMEQVGRNDKLPVTGNALVQCNRRAFLFQSNGIMRLASIARLSPNSPKYYARCECQ